MKKLEVYVCEICNSQYSNEVGASRCEEEHRTKEEMSIVSAIYDKADSAYGADISFRRKVPKKVIIKFSEGHGDFATYVLEHYGYKGI